MDTFYEAGKTAHLTTSDGRGITVVVKRLCSITVSPVLEVEIQSPNGPHSAILKMFDRRFYKHVRDKNPYNEQAEASWERYIRSGKAEASLERRRAAEEEDIRICQGEQVRDEDEDEGKDDEDDESESDEEGDLETDLFWNHQLGFQNEVHAYSKLKELQGGCVPHFIDSVNYSRSKPSDLPAKYFDVPGILLEYVPSFQIVGLTTKVPDQPYNWKEIICQAKDAATQINNAGVVNSDNSAWNYIVAQPQPGNFRVCMIDFSKAVFQEQIKATDDPDDEDGWPFFVMREANPIGIAIIMKKRVLNETGLMIEIEGVTMVS